MITGIYRLDFSSGAFYIGKSIDIIGRWAQHADKMVAGKAAKLMQAEYDVYGLPEGTIIKQCHSDHIDILEESFISRLRPPLNGTKPKDPLAGLNTFEFEYFLDNIEESTIEHLEAIRALEKSLAKQTEVISDLNSRYKIALVARNEEEVKSVLNVRIKELERAAVVKGNLLKMYSDEIAYNRLPWYKKLFK